MKKIFLFFICIFCISTISVAQEKAYIVFSASLKEIDNKEQGGYAQLASMLETYRNKKTPTFFIFGGGALFPSVLSSFDHGTHIVDLLNTLEPDVMAANRGDFAFTEDELSLRTYEAAFPIVQSNMVKSKSKQRLDGVLDSIILQQGHHKLGFISVMDDIDLEMYNLTNVILKDQNQVIKERTKALREIGVDFIILHYGGSDLNCAELLENGIVDIVLRNKIYIKSEKKFKLLQHPRQYFLTEANQAILVELNWQKGDPKTLTIQAQKEPLSNYPKNPVVEQQIKNYAGQLDLLLGEIIGTTTADMFLSKEELRTKENGYANLVADLIKKHTGSDIALINSGSIRGQEIYHKGANLSRKDIVKTLPYRNTIVLLDITGKELLSALENGFSQIINMSGRFPQVAGMNITYNSQAEVGHRVTSVKVNGKVLDLSASYRLATTLYIAKGGDGYNMFQDNEPINYNRQMSTLASDILINELRLTNIISPNIDNRMIDTVKVANHDK